MNKAQFLFPILLLLFGTALAEDDPNPSGYWHQGYPYDIKYCNVSDVATAKACGCTGVWLPEDPVLFRPFIADPRKVIYSTGWRFNDSVIARNVIDVSYGETIALYRWFNRWPYGGDLQIELEGACWAVFSPLKNESAMVNADYYFGFPLTYCTGRWQFRLRPYHISCHLGDEFLISHPGFVRKNPSAEYLDFSISHDLTDEIRLYTLIGCVLHSDPTFKCGHFFADTGFEVRIPRFGFINTCQKVYGAPFFAIHMRYREEFKDHVDLTYVLGYEWSKLSGLCRRLRIYLEYHDGYSVEGQFCWEPTSYTSLRIGYGY